MTSSADCEPPLAGPGVNLTRRNRNNLPLWWCSSCQVMQARRNCWVCGRFSRCVELISRSGRGYGVVNRRRYLL